MPAQPLLQGSTELGLPHGLRQTHGLLCSMRDAPILRGKDPLDEGAQR